MCWLYSSLFHSKKFTKAGGSFYTAVADLKLWQSVHRFHGNAELNCIYVGKPMPRGLSHSARSSSYGSFEHLLFRIQPSSSTKASSTLLATDVCFFTVHWDRDRVSHTPQLQAWYPGKREKAQCEEQTQKEDSCVIFIILNHWCRQKQGCTIVTNLYSYFHSLILNSLTWGIISTAFPVFLFYTTWSAASSLCKIWRSKFWPPRNNPLVMHAVSKATWGTEGEVGPATHSFLSSQLEHRPWLSAVSSSELQVPLLLTFYSSWISKRERQDLANCRIQSLRKINTQSTQNNNHLLYKNMLRVSGE